MQEQLKAQNKKLSDTTYCQNYIGAGCFDDNCKKMHVEKEEVDKFKASKKALAAAKAKAKKAAKRSQSAAP